MRLPNSPHHQVEQIIATLIAGFGLGLIVGTVWAEPEPTKLIAGAALTVLAFMIMVFWEIGLL